MNQELLEEAIDHWEPKGANAEVVRTIDSTEGTVERIVKFRASNSMEIKYSLYRYFEMAPEPATLKVYCSVDLDGVYPDRVIQHLAVRL